MYIDCHIDSFICLPPLVCILNDPKGVSSREVLDRLSSLDTSAVKWLIGVCDVQTCKTDEEPHAGT